MLRNELNVESGTLLPSVSVIVPVYNGVDLLRGCLDALRRQTYPADLVEVLVVDNNSEDDISTAMPDDHRFVLLHEPQRGSYAARNKALTLASGSVIAFTDADCSPHPSWLQEGVAVLRHQPPAAMVGGAVRLVYKHGSPRTGSEIYEFLYAFKQDWYLTVNRYAATANVLTWRTTIDSVGPFDARLQSRGDAEWGRRVAAAGGEQRYAPLAIVNHPARAELSELLRKQLRVARGRRDVEVSEGRSLRHFLGTVYAQFPALISAVRDLRTEEVDVSPLGRARFIVVAAMVRTIYAGTALSGAATVTRCGLLTRRESRPSRGR